VVVALLGVELLTRLVFYGMSKDFRAYSSYPGRAAALGGGNGLAVAVIGNSVAHEGVDAGILADSLGHLRNVPIRADILSADHSYVNAWHYMIKRFFWDAGNDVDIVVIPFWRDNLYDGNDIDLGRLAQFFTTLADWPEVLTTDLSTTSARLGFIASDVSAGFAARERMQQFVFLRLFPPYREFATLEQQVSVEHLRLFGKPRRTGRPTLRVLERLVAAARQHGTQLCFVAVPTLHPEWNDPYAEVRAVVEPAGMTYVDLREMRTVDASSFVDLVHMNAAGRAVLSHELAQAVARLVRCEGTVCRVGSMGARLEVPRGAAGAPGRAS